MAAMLMLSSCDCLNEKGLYIEVNLREYTEELCCYGLHSSRGEKTRDDGTPWRELTDRIPVSGKMASIV